MTQMFQDGVQNLVAEIGTSRDKATHVTFTDEVYSDHDLYTAFRSSWLARKIVTVPALDTFRQWREWQATEHEVELLEAEEQRLGLKRKLPEAYTLARLFGTAYLYFGFEGNPAEPLDATKVKKGGIKYVTVLTPSQLVPYEYEDDVLSENYGKPRLYTVNSTTGISAMGQVRVHPSRIVVLTGHQKPIGIFSTGGEVGQDRLGDSVLQSCMEDIKRFEATAANIASLIYESKVDVIRVKGLMNIAGDPLQSRKLLERYRLAATAKSNNGMLLLDMETEEYSSKTAVFSTLPDIMDRFGLNVSGAGDIPATRLFGRSPAGMNATGESDNRNYLDRIKADQEVIIRPAMAALDEAIIWSALGSRPPEIHYIWASLWQMSDKERADLGSSYATAIKTLHDTGLIPEEVLSKVVVVMMTQAGAMPGLETEYKDYFDKGGEAPWDEEDPEAGGTPPPAGGNPPPRGGQPTNVQDSDFTDDQPRAPKGSSNGGQWVKGGGGAGGSSGGGAAQKAAESMATKKYTAAQIMAVVNKPPGELSHYEKKVVAKYKKALAAEVASEGAGKNTYEKAKAAGKDVTGKKAAEAKAAAPKPVTEAELEAAYQGYMAEIKKSPMGYKALNKNSATTPAELEHVANVAAAKRKYEELDKQYLAQKKAKEAAEAPPKAEAPKAEAPKAQPSDAKQKALAAVATSQYPKEKIEALFDKDPKTLSQYEKKKLLAYKKALQEQGASPSVKSEPVGAPTASPAAPVKGVAKSAAGKAAEEFHAKQAPAAPGGTTGPLKVNPDTQALMTQTLAKKYNMQAATVEKLASGDWKPDPKKSYQADVAKLAAEIKTGTVSQATYNKILGENPSTTGSAYEGIKIAAKNPPPLTTFSSSQAGLANGGTLTDSEQYAVQAYSGSAYKTINNTLRSGGALTGQAQNLQNAVMKHTATKDLVLTRGVSQGALKAMGVSDISQLKPGGVITDKGFVSTTRKTSIAEQFSQGGYALKVIVPKGKSVLPMKELSHYAKEDEFLLPAGSQFRVIGVTANKVVTVELV